MRQALEWGGQYKFWSCADVDIITQKLSSREACSNHGILDMDKDFKGFRFERSEAKPEEGNNGSCKCDKNYYGEMCQYMNDCTDDLDCQNDGKYVIVK